MNGRFIDNLPRVYGLYTGGFIVFIGTSGGSKNGGVMGFQSRMSGSVSFTKAFMKKKSEFSGWNMFMAVRPINVHITTPRP